MKLASVGFFRAFGVCVACALPVFRKWLNFVVLTDRMNTIPFLSYQNELEEFEHLATLVAVNTWGGIVKGGSPSRVYTPL